MLHLTDLKFYFYLESSNSFENASYDTTVEFEKILQIYQGKELDLRDKLRFAPVLFKDGHWLHAITPLPGSCREWPHIARHAPFALEGLEGRYVLEFTGSIMLRTGRIVTGGSVNNFEDIFTKLIAPRSLRVKRMDQPAVKEDKFARIDSSLYKF